MVDHGQVLHRNALAAGLDGSTSVPSFLSFATHQIRWNWRYLWRRVLASDGVGVLASACSASGVLNQASIQTAHRRYSLTLTCRAGRHWEKSTTRRATSTN
jgi:hypothetical protein